MESNQITFIDIINANNCVLYECGGAAYQGATYGLRLRSGVSSIVLLSCSFSGGYRTAAISIEDSSGTPGTGNTFIGVTANNTSGTAWTMPTKAATARFINSANPAPIFAFANLPSSGMVFGDEYIISNSSLATTSGNFGSPVSGGGSNTAKVRWNGSSWIVV
jgi:hypothetical protein